jgi:hypothetical protein
MLRIALEQRRNQIGLVELSAEIRPRPHNRAAADAEQIAVAGMPEKKPLSDSTNQWPSLLTTMVAMHLSVSAF